MLFERNAFDVEHIYSVEPGKYTADPPTIESPEFLVIGRKG